MFETWNHLPQFVRAIILGNVIQAVFVAVVRGLMRRFTWLKPWVDRLGPKALRSRAGRTGEGIAIAIGWFLLSWYVGHKAMKLRGQLVGWVVKRS